MTRFTSSAALAGIALALAGCVTDDTHLTPVHNPSIYSVNQPVVQRTDYVIDVSASGGVPATEKARLADWFDSLRLGYGDRVYVDQSGYGDTATRADIAEVAGDYGVLLSEGAPVSAGNAAPGTARVIVSRAVASVPGCPNWDGEFGTPVQTSSNYGCATNSNLAAMVADPNDLVLGQSGAGIDDAGQGSKAVKLYRERTPTGSGGLKSEKTGGK